MKTWRVGTFSMGASLLLLGIYLILSQLMGLDITNMLISWWPVILVVLGIEILLYLLFSKQEKPYLKYDILSIFFVGILGTVGIGAALISSTGIVDKVSASMDREHRTHELPAYEQAVSKEVKRVVIETGNNAVTIEGSNAKDVSMFGTYTASSGKNEKLIETAKDYVSSTVKGDTLYLAIKDIPNEAVGMFDQYGMMSPTILVPQNVKLEVVGNHNKITIKPRKLMSDWSIDKSSYLDIQLEENSDVKLVASKINDIVGELKDWKIKKESINEEDEEYDYDDSGLIEEAAFQLGKGSHEIQINDTSQVQLKIVH
ncbi:hypothetical protein HRF87_19775 [Bacillus sp. CRN 9]|nr:hypothetical protein [Bacillus sp. CRN 9]